MSPNNPILLTHASGHASFDENAFRKNGRNGSDIPWRIEHAQHLQRLMKSGAVVSSGTDAPVEDVDLIANYYAAVTRKLPDAASLTNRSA